MLNGSGGSCWYGKYGESIQFTMLERSKWQFVMEIDGTCRDDDAMSSVRLETEMMILMLEKLRSEMKMELHSPRTATTTIEGDGDCWGGAFVDEVTSVVEVVSVEVVLDEVVVVVLDVFVEIGFDDGEITTTPKLFVASDEHTIS